MDTRADQNHSLVLFTFVLALSQTIQTQVREKVIGWQGQTISQNLAAATQFCGNLEKDKKAKKIKPTVLV